MEYIEKTIYCPKCEQKVGTYDGRSKTDKICRCRACNRRIIYHIDTGEVEAKKIPVRNTASGMSFI